MLWSDHGHKLWLLLSQKPPWSWFVFLPVHLFTNSPGISYSATRCTQKWTAVTSSPFSHVIIAVNCFGSNNWCLCSRWEDTVLIVLESLLLVMLLFLAFILAACGLNVLLCFFSKPEHFPRFTAAHVDTVWHTVRFCCNKSWKVSAKRVGSIFGGMTCHTAKNTKNHQPQSYLLCPRVATRLKNCLYRGVESTLSSTDLRATCWTLPRVPAITNIWPSRNDRKGEKWGFSQCSIYCSSGGGGSQNKCSFPSSHHSQPQQLRTRQ